MFFIETPSFGRGYVYLGGYVLEKLQRSGGGTFIWGGTSIWHWIVLKDLHFEDYLSPKFKWKTVSDLLEIHLGFHHASAACGCHHFLLDQ